MAKPQDDSIALLQQMVRNASLGVMKQHAGMESLQIGAVTGDTKVHGHWMTMILLTAGAVRVSFKVHFMTAAGKVLSRKIYANGPAALGSHQEIDFFKEYCNLTAGKLKNHLMSRGIDSGISLPLCTRGFDEVYAPLPDQKSLFTDFWQLRDESVAIVCSTYIDTHQVTDLSALSEADLNQIDQPAGEIEFL